MRERIDNTKLRDLYALYSLQQFVDAVLAMRAEWAAIVDSPRSWNINARHRTITEAHQQLEAADTILSTTRAMAAEWGSAKAEVLLPHGCIERSDGMLTLLKHAIHDIFSIEEQEHLLVRIRREAGKDDLRQVLSHAIENNDHEYAVRNQLSATVTGRTCLKIAADNRIGFNFYDTHTYGPVRNAAVYSHQQKKIYIVHNGPALETADITESAVHELTHADQHSRFSDLYTATHAVDGYVATKLLEAGAYAAEAAHKQEAKGLSVPDFDQEALQQLFSATPSGVNAFLEARLSPMFAHCRKFMKTLQTASIMCDYELHHITEPMLSVVKTGQFRDAVRGSKFLTSSYLSSFCRTPTGESWFDIEPSAMRVMIVGAIETPRHPFLKKMVAKYTAVQPLSVMTL